MTRIGSSQNRRAPALARALGTAALSVLLLMGCDRKPESTTELGKGGSEVSGSAGPAGTRQANRQLVQCAAPVATDSLAERRDGYGQVLGRYGLPESPLPLLRVVMQQSGCFRIVDRNTGLGGAITEQELKDQGILRRDGSTVQRGRGFEAQYTIVPALTFSETDAGRSVAGVLGQIPVVRDFAVLIGLVEQARFKEAQAVLLLTDNETTEQLAAATGSARATDFGIGGLLLGRVGAGGLGWSNTNEGKIITAAFLDAHNQLVSQVRALAPRPLPPPVPSLPVPSLPVRRN